MLKAKQLGDRAVPLFNTFKNAFQVLIWHDNTGLEPGWFLSRVVVRDIQTNKKYYFLCEDWLCLWKGDGVIQKDLYVASEKFTTPSVF